MLQDFEKRVGILEDKVELLEQLPARVTALESQILQLREEMGTEFSAVRSEIRAGDQETQRLMRVLHEETLARIETLDRG
jgi:predicted  nucleic acid-binding Zn-ribbon protein